MVVRDGVCKALRRSLRSATGRLRNSLWRAATWGAGSDIIPPGTSTTHFKQLSRTCSTFCFLSILSGYLPIWFLLPEGQLVVSGRLSSRHSKSPYSGPFLQLLAPGQKREKASSWGDGSPVVRSAGAGRSGTITTSHVERCERNPLSISNLQKPNRSLTLRHFSVYILCTLPSSRHQCNRHERAIESQPDVSGIAGAFK